MKTEEFEALKEAHPYTETLTAACGDWVVPELWWDEDDMKWGYVLHPVAAWITRTNIHPSISAHVSTFAALISTYDFGMIPADDDELLPRTDVMSPILRAEVPTMEREWKKAVEVLTGRTGWTKLEPKKN